MQIIERDVLVDPNESGDYWYIPVTFRTDSGEQIVDMSDYDIHMTASTVVVSNDTVEYHELVTTGWMLNLSDQPTNNLDYFYALKVPKVTSNYQFTQYINVYIYLEDKNTFEVVSTVVLNIRKAPTSGGGSTAAEVAEEVWNYGSSSEAETITTRTLSSSVDVDPDAIAEAVWNYGAAEGDETITDRTLSTTVEVNPSAIAQAVWNYSVAEPASGTLGTRTLTTAIPTVANIATAVLTTDVGTMVVGTDDYTVKHLIMASQKSEVVTDNGATVWKIRDERLDSETNEATVIASRTLTINSNGAIVKTE